MKYYSTNRRAPKASFREALLRGQAPDGGLYMPEVIPLLSRQTISAFQDLPYHDIAFRVLREFLGEEIPEGELQNILREAHNFEIPIEKVRERIYLMRLDQGPTASFKDFGARVEARLMDYYVRVENKNLLVLAATSGDTGGAVAHAFYGLDSISMVVLFPKNEVSERQRKQMTTLGKNITAIAVAGKFDDCQAMIKQAFGDLALERLNLTSANSINIGRLLPQAVYYFYAFAKLRQVREELIFSVPCGNFGNLMGGLIAKKMGLPVHQFIAATNENDEFPKFLEDGEYTPIRPSKPCLSSAMNVGHPSNLARVIDLYQGRMDENGKIHQVPDINSMRKDIFSISISDRETKQTIKDIYQKDGVLLEPHGAVAFAALEKYLSQTPNLRCAVSFETAHPAKFPEAIEETLGIQVEVPESMQHLEEREEMFEQLPVHYPALREFLISKFGVRG